MRALSFLALAAPLVSAIQFEAPVANSTILKGDTVNVKWSFVDTDPTKFSIYLVNFVDWPPFYTQVASDVPTDAGEWKVKVPCDVNTSWGFQFNAINGTNVYVIHAQTPRFFVKDGTCSGEADEPTEGNTCKPVTVTTTVTATSTVTSCPNAETSTAMASQQPASSEAKPTVKGSVDGPAQPAVTNPPVGPNESQNYGITRTIYQTVYADLSEADGCVC